MPKVEDVLSAQSRVNVNRDSITFNAFSDDQKTAALTVSLPGMVEAGDSHGLLLFGVFMQLAQLNHRLDEQERRMASADNSDHMDKALSKVMSVLREAGMAPQA